MSKPGDRSEDLDRIEEHVRALDNAAAVNVLRFRRKTLGEAEALYIERDLNPGFRYVRVATVDVPGHPWKFQILAGTARNADPNEDFDAKRGGDFGYVIDLVRRWMIELSAWTSIPDPHTG